MTIVLGQQAPGWLEWVRLGATVLAALAVIAAAIVTAVLTTRRESDSWLRERRADAYKTFIDAVDEAIDLVVIDVSNAIHHPKFAGLEEAREAALGRHGNVSTQMMGALLFAGDAMPEAARSLMGSLGDVMSRAAPLLGVNHRAALAQYKACIGFLVTARLNLLEAMRHDLRRRTLRKASPPEFADLQAQVSEWAQAQEVNPRKTLVEWRVRRWTATSIDEPSEETGYVTDSYPWAFVKASSTELVQPLAAVLRRAPGTAWILAISDEVTNPADVAKLELAALRVVVHGGTNTDDPFGYGLWAEAGANDEEKLYFWPIAVL